MTVAGRGRAGLDLTSICTKAAAGLAAVALAMTPTAVAAVAAGSGRGDRGEAGIAAPHASRGAAAAVPTPPDLIRSRQWYLWSVRAPAAWKYSRGSGVTVAVLDTGVDGQHPDLTGHVYAGPDYTGRARRPGNKFWGRHGTGMASIISGHGNGGGARGVLGIAPASRVLAIRVTWENDDPLRQNAATLSRSRDAVARAIRYAVDRGADVINMSFGGWQQFSNGDSVEESAVKYALSKGVVLIASGGNDGTELNRRNFPAAYQGVIAVGALDRRLRVWEDTSRHDYISVCAPGVEIVSADAGRGYILATGTSPSAAIVAGVAALVRARYPKLTPEQVRQALQKGVVRRGADGRPLTGAPSAEGSRICRGSVDAVRTLAAAAKLNKAGPPAAAGGTASAAPAPSEEPDRGNAGLLIKAILAAGGVLVLIGFILGWRQRRRPEEDFDLSPYQPYQPYEPYEWPAAGGGFPPGWGPVNVPPWQSNDPLAGVPMPPSAPPARRPSPGPGEAWHGSEPGHETEPRRGAERPGFQRPVAGAGGEAVRGGFPGGPPEDTGPPAGNGRGHVVPGTLRPYDASADIDDLLRGGASNGAQGGNGEGRNGEGRNGEGRNGAGRNGAGPASPGRTGSEGFRDFGDPGDFPPGLGLPARGPGDGSPLDDFRIGLSDDDPLGGGSVPPAPLSETPLADESWQKLLAERSPGTDPADYAAGENLSPDEIPTGASPVVPPLDELEGLSPDEISTGAWPVVPPLEEASPDDVPTGGSRVVPAAELSPDDVPTGATPVVPPLEQDDERVTEALPTISPAGRAEPPSPTDLAEDDRPTSALPSVGRPNDPSRRAPDTTRPEQRPADEDDYRPPWW